MDISLTLQIALDFTIKIIKALLTVFLASILFAILSFPIIIVAAIFSIFMMIAAACSMGQHSYGMADSKAVNDVAGDMGKISLWIVTIISIAIIIIGTFNILSSEKYYSNQKEDSLDLKSYFSTFLQSLIPATILAGLWAFLLPVLRTDFLNIFPKFMVLIIKSVSGLLATFSPLTTFAILTVVSTLVITGAILALDKAGLFDSERLQNLREDVKEIEPVKNPQDLKIKNVESLVERLKKYHHQDKIKNIVKGLIDRLEKSAPDPSLSNIIDDLYANHNITKKNSNNFINKINHQNIQENMHQNIQENMGVK
jgi:hypothetical protein